MGLLSPRWLLNAAAVAGLILAATVALAEDDCQEDCHRGVFNGEQQAARRCDCPHCSCAEAVDKLSVWPADEADAIAPADVESERCARLIVELMESLGRSPLEDTVFDEATPAGLDWLDEGNANREGDVRQSLLSYLRHLDAQCRQGQCDRSKRQLRACRSHDNDGGAMACNAGCPGNEECCAVSRGCHCGAGGSACACPQACCPECRCAPCTEETCDAARHCCHEENCEETCQEADCGARCGSHGPPGAWRPDSDPYEPVAYQVHELSEGPEHAVAMLRETSLGLEQHANRLEEQGVYHRADQLRELAEEMRHEARWVREGLAHQQRRMDPLGPPPVEEALRREIEHLRRELHEVRQDVNGLDGAGRR
jgi:hypothetical protein